MSADRDSLGIGVESIERDEEPIYRGHSEGDIARAIGLAVDSLGDLTKYLPLPAGAGETFRDAMFDAWRALLEDCMVCNAEDGDGVDDNIGLSESLNLEG